MYIKLESYCDTSLGAKHGIYWGNVATGVSFKYCMYLDGVLSRGEYKTTIEEEEDDLGGKTILHINTTPVYFIDILATPETLHQLHKLIQQDTVQITLGSSSLDTYVIENLEIEDEGEQRDGVHNLKLKFEGPALLKTLCTDASMTLEELYLIKLDPAEDGSELTTANAVQRIAPSSDELTCKTYILDASNNNYSTALESVRIRVKGVNPSTLVEHDFGYWDGEANNPAGGADKMQRATEWVDGAYGPSVFTSTNNIVTTSAAASGEFGDGNVLVFDKGTFATTEGFTDANALEMYFYISVNNNPEATLRFPIVTHSGVLI
jgi:hypothetical protein